MTTSPPPADWELKQLVVDERTPTETSTTIHTIMLESPASPDPPIPTDDDTKLAPALKREYDAEFAGYGAHASPVSSDADTDPLPELRFTPAVQTLPKVSASTRTHHRPHQRHVGPRLQMMTTLTTTVAWWTTARMLSSITSDV